MSTRCQPWSTTFTDASEPEQASLFPPTLLPQSEEGHRETRSWASTSSGAFLCRAPGRPNPTGVGWASRRTRASIPKPIIHMVLSKQALYSFPRPQCKHLVLQHLVSTSFSPDLCHFQKPPGPAPALWRGQQGQRK